MTNRPADSPDPVPHLELLTHAEQNLSQATFRLGRLRTRHRGSDFHRDLTALFYDVQAAREAIVAVLKAGPEIGSQANRSSDR